MSQIAQIGLSARLIDQIYTVKETYVKAIKSTQSIPIILTPQSEMDLELIIDKLDGIVILGGYDIDSALYHEEARSCIGIDPIIDAFDISLINLAIKKNKPILGICRGLQIINVALGGSLYQDLNDDFSDQIDHNYSAKHETPLEGHLISIDVNSVLYPIFGNELMVNSYHHQGIKDLAESLTAIAYSPDGLIEAISGPNILAVQWHPERMITQLSTLNFFKAWIKSINQTSQID